MDIRTLVSDRNSEEDFNDELVNLLAAGAGIIHVRAAEMLRGLHATRRALLLDPEMEVYEWDMINGMERLTTEHIYAKRTDGDKEPQLHKAIEDHVVAKYQWWESGAASDADKLRSYSYIFFNPPGAAMNSPLFQQHLMELSHFLPATEIRVIFVTNDEPPPEDIAHTMVSIDFDRPGHGELVEHIDETLKDVEEVTIDMDEQQQARLAVAGAGMTRSDFEMALSRAVIDLCAEVEEDDEDPHVDPEEIIRYVSNMKTEIVKQNDLLELLQAESMSSVGGMEALKEWVRQRSECFSDEAREFGIEEPKGAVLVGVPGTGKSLAAKAVASEFGIPLLKLDFSNMFQSLVGSSETRMRTALKMVESMAPCVLFADEIDKGLGGIGSGGDAGTSQRVLGTFLSWLQDNKAPVFTIVTANNVNGLPPELLRRGRFDATFSTMLPNEFEREDVFRIHLEKRNHSLEEFTEDEIIEFLSKTAGFVPAEIEAVVKDALILAFNDKPRELTMGHLLNAVSDTVSLSVSRSKEMEEMVKWAQENATPASWTAEDRAAKEGRKARLTADGKVRGRGTATSGTGRPGGTVRNLQPSRRRKSPTKPKGDK